MTNLPKSEDDGDVDTVIVITGKKSNLYETVEL